MELRSLNTKFRRWNWLFTTKIVLGLASASYPMDLGVSLFVMPGA
jgi:hypothetical protein